MNNVIVQLCVLGMNQEGAGRIEDAHQIFQQAWDEATHDVEKFTSAHYLGRHQECTEDKLKWDKTA